MYWIVTPHCVCFMQPLYFRHHRDSYMYSFLRRPYFIQLCVACATKIVQCILVVRVSDPSDMAYYTCCVNDHVLCQMAPLFLCFITLADYQPALTLVSFTSNFSERLSTFSYSFQESCSLYPKCTPYVSVEHTVPPQSVVSNSSSGCSVEYTICNLMRCVRYQSTATALLSDQRGIPIVVGSTVMQSE